VIDEIAKTLAQKGKYEVVPGQQSTARRISGKFQNQFNRDRQRESKKEKPKEQPAESIPKPNVPKKRRAGRDHEATLGVNQDRN